MSHNMKCPSPHSCSRVPGVDTAAATPCWHRLVHVRGHHHHHCTRSNHHAEEAVFLWELEPGNTQPRMSILMYLFRAGCPSCPIQEAQGKLQETTKQQDFLSSQELQLPPFHKETLPLTHLGLPNTTLTLTSEPSTTPTPILIPLTPLPSPHPASFRGTADIKPPSLESPLNSSPLPKTSSIVTPKNHNKMQNTLLFSPQVIPKGALSTAWDKPGSLRHRPKPTCLCPHWSL